MLLIEVIPISLFGIETRRNSAAGVPDSALNGLLEMPAQVVRLLRERSPRWAIAQRDPKAPRRLRLV